MMSMRLLSTAAMAISPFLAGACSTVSPTPRALAGSNEVTPVVTEHSFGLQCLGSLIDQAGLPAIVVEVDRIRDRTIPERLSRPSRLSQGGEWRVVTDISKLETKRVRLDAG